MTEIPKKKEIVQTSTPSMPYNPVSLAYGFNQCHELMTTAVIKRLEGIKRAPIKKDRELRSYEKLENSSRSLNNCLINNIILEMRGE